MGNAHKRKKLARIEAAKQAVSATEAPVVETLPEEVTVETIVEPVVETPVVEEVKAAPKKKKAVVKEE
jgi:hypothetical protein